MTISIITMIIIFDEEWQNRFHYSINLLQLLLLSMLVDVCASFSCCPRNRYHFNAHKNSIQVYDNNNMYGTRDVDPHINIMCVLKRVCRAMLTIFEARPATREHVAIFPFSIPLLYVGSLLNTLRACNGYFLQVRQIILRWF